MNFADEYHWYFQHEKRIIIMSHLTNKYLDKRIKLEINNAMVEYIDKTNVAQGGTMIVVPIIHVWTYGRSFITYALLIRASFLFSKKTENVH